MFRDPNAPINYFTCRLDGTAFRPASQRARDWLLLPCPKAVMDPFDLPTAMHFPLIELRIGLGTFGGEFEET